MLKNSLLAQILCVTILNSFKTYSKRRPIEHTCNISNHDSENNVLYLDIGISTLNKQTIDIWSIKLTLTLDRVYGLSLHEM